MFPFIFPSCLSILPTRKIFRVQDVSILGDICRWDKPVGPEYTIPYHALKWWDGTSNYAASSMNSWFDFSCRINLALHISKASCRHCSVICPAISATYNAPLPSDGDTRTNHRRYVVPPFRPKRTRQFDPFQINSTDTFQRTAIKAI